MLEDPVAEFVTECLENLDRFEQGLLTLEREPSARDVLDDMFRAIHTIKGSAGFFAFDIVGRISHAGENLLSAMREGRMTADGPRASLLLEMSDVLRRQLNGGLTAGKEPPFDDVDLVERLKVTLRLGLGERIEPAVAVQSASPPAPPEVTDTAGNKQAAAGSENNDRSLRVDVEVIDRLMDIAGEIVLARNQILRLAASSSDPAHLAAAQRLNVITSELQERVMKTRMQPIGTVWSKFPRLVRDIANLCKKQVRLEFSGGDTELDKSVVESIKDPLTHLIRNSVDHGIEAAETRAARGKPAEGVIAMRAYAEGGHVIIEVSDDGGGIDAARVTKLALQRGVITNEEAARLTPREAMALIFRPGFSTAETVSQVSGRGVGMDVVRTNLQKLGGVVDVDSELGSGTTVRLTIPLTLAIVPALIVTCGTGRYAIPQSCLVELVNIRPGDTQHRIERIHEAIVFRLRGDIIPIIDLSRELAIESAWATNTSIKVAVLEVANGRFGVIVGEINDTVEIVVKPLAVQLHTIALFAGATILGDGSIALILDMPELAHRAALGEGAEGRHIRAAAVAHATKNTLTAVVARLTSGAQIAIPMDQITRLERIPHTRMEWGDGRRVVQYRGTLMWCMDLAEQLGLGLGDDTLRDLADMIVVEADHQPIGLIVAQVLDVVEIDLATLTPSSRSGFVGAAVVFERVTDVIDLNAVLTSLGVYPENRDAA